MKKVLIYFILFLLPTVYSCLDTPDMTVGIANMKEQPTVKTLSDRTFSNMNFTLTIKGQILNYGKESNSFKYGFCYGTDSTLLVDTTFITKSISAEIDTFSYELQNLDGNLTYYWRAVAKNQYGTDLGDIQKFGTPSVYPSITTGQDSPAFADGSLLFTGEIQSVGKINKVFKKGFCWGTNSGNLTDTVFLENTNFEPGAFSYVLENVRGNTTYYWQAFAKNDFGISFGVVNNYPTPVIFSKDNPFTGILRSYFALFTLNNDLYLTCGFIGLSNFSDILRFDKFRWWTNIPGLPGGNINGRRYPVAFTIGDSLAYVGTGQASTSNIFGDFYIFNANTQTWTENSIQTPAEMPRYEAVAFSLKNKGYVVGGRTGSVALNDVWEYSITNGIDSWKKNNNFPSPFYGGICFYNNEKVFAGFGNTNTLWEYDVVNDVWEEFASSPLYSYGGSANICSGIIFQDKIYLLDITNNIWELDLATKMYKQKSTLPSDFPSLTEQYMFSLGNTIYIGLGGTTLLYRYNPLWDN